MRFSIRPLALLLIGNTLFASDGVLEINQACAVNTGCIATDSAGFPVQITAGGSYVLSGNLDLTSTPGVNAIEVNASEVNLNLAGFRIFGPTSCSGTPGVDFLCSPLDIDANGISIAPGAVGTTIRNGTIRGMPGSGISGSDSVATRVSELLVTENGNDGIDLGDKAQVSETRAIEKSPQWNRARRPGAGESCHSINPWQQRHRDWELFAVSHSTSSSSTLRGFELGHSSRYRANTSVSNLLNDVCGGGICTERKRYYLTPDAAYNGAQPTTACAAGFHMAAMFELHDPSSWQYDTVLGYTEADSGYGPLTAFEGGWIRTGVNSLSGSNCQAWTSDDGGHSGRSLNWTT